jgi:hypothetical protein
MRLGLACGQGSASPAWRHLRAPGSDRPAAKLPTPRDTAGQARVNCVAYFNPVRSGPPRTPFVARNPPAFHQAISSPA